MKNIFLTKAIELAKEKSKDGRHGPFGAVVVFNDEIIGEGWNQVVDSNDPTAHAEITAIRNACSKINKYDLSGCTIYSSCEPCPMCLSAILWSRINKIVFSCTKEDAAKAGFDDEIFYNEIRNDWTKRNIKWEQMDQSSGLNIFEDWIKNPNKILY